MRSIRTFFYCLKQGIRSMIHNGMFSLASIGTIAASLFLLGLFFFVTMNVRFVVKEAEQNVGVTVLFDEGITEEQMQVIGDAIRGRGEVANVVFISAEEAWETYKKDHLNAELAATFGEDNPLENSASFKVFLKEVAMQDNLVQFIESLDGVRKVNALEGVAESLGGINQIITVISVSIILILIAVAIFLIRMTVSMGISVRKEEISIMHIIGATDFFIRFPFVVEGLILGLIGGGLAFLAEWGLYQLLTEKLMTGLIGNLVTIIPFNVLFLPMLCVYLLIGIVVGVFGSSIAIRKFLKV